jgi:hypothetical protein
VDEARRNSHRPRDLQQEYDMLIYNWLPHYTGRQS